MVERVAPGDVGEVEEAQKDVDSSDSVTTEETTSQPTEDSTTDQPQMEAPSNEPNRFATSEGRTREDEAPAPGGEPQMDAPMDEPARHATSEGRTPQDQAPAPGGDPQMEARMDEPMRGPASRPGSERVDTRQSTGGAPERVRPDSSKEDLQAAAKDAEGQQQEFEGISKAEEQQSAGPTSTSPDTTDVESSGSDGGPGLRDSLWAASPVGAFAASKVGSGDKVGSSKMAGDIGLGDIASDPSGSLDAIQRGGEFLPSTWNFGQRDVREMTGSHLVINEDAGSGDFDSLAVGNVPMETSIEVGGDKRQLPISTTAPGPFGAGLSGARGASRASAQLLRSKKPWELSRTARTGPVGGQQVAEGVAKYGKFAPEGAEKIVASTVAATPFAAAEINTPTTREEFTQEEVGVPEDRSDFVQEEIAAPEQSDFSRGEVGVPEETETFSELDVPSNLGGRASDSVVINRDGDVSVILSAQQMFRDPKQDEDDLLDVPDEFLPEDDVVIGEREDDINTFDQPTGNELAEQVEEQEVDWKQQQQRDILSDESTQTDTLGDLTEESVGDTFLPGQGTQSVASPSVGTGTSVGGLLDEETTADVDAQPSVGLDNRTGLNANVGQSPVTDQGLGVDTDLGLGDLFETGAETRTDIEPGFGNPNAQEFPHETGFGQGSGQGDGPPGVSLGLGLPVPSAQSDRQSSSSGIFEQQYEVDLPDAEDVLFGSDKKKKDDGFLGDFGSDLDGGLGDLDNLGKGFDLEGF